MEYIIEVEVPDDWTQANVTAIYIQERLKAVSCELQACFPYKPMLQATRAYHCQSDHETPEKT